VDQPRLDEHRQISPFVVKKELEAIHALGDRVRRWRNEGRVSGARAADPVLAPPEFTGLLIAPPAFRQEDSVDLSDQPEREGKTAAHPVEAMV